MARHVALVCAFCLLNSPAPALAGMPSFGLTEVARLRVETISFFLLVFLVAAWVIQRLWNWLGNDFVWLPRLSYGKAVGVTTVWGLLFVIVLTMISGARELMTPGAWEKKGSTYRLREQPKPAEPAESTRTEPQLAERRKQLDRLWVVLTNYATIHDGHFPEDEQAAEIPPTVWQVPGANGIRYVYVKRLAVGGPAVPLVYEPNLFGDDPLVLMNSGEVRTLPTAEIVAMLPREAAP